MLIYCWNCGEYHEAVAPTVCPYCEAVGDELYVEEGEEGDE